LTTPVRAKYQKRIEEGYGIQDQSPCFDVFKKLHSKAFPSTLNDISDKNLTLDILANVALQGLPRSSSEEPSIEHSCSSELISPVLSESLVFPKAQESVKPTRRTLLSSLPDNITSSESIRTMSLKELEKVKAFAAKSIELNKVT